MNIFFTGGAGFIGSNFVDYLLNHGHEIIVCDNLSTGQERFVENAFKSNCFKFLKQDLLSLPELKKAMHGCDFVFHFAANADVRFGIEHPQKDLEQNTIVTFNVLESMRANNIYKIAFSSTGSIYGEPDIFPTPENAPFPIQTSLYGASKLACEGLIQAYAEAFNIQCFIFRFVSILGERYSHGHVFDFYKSLRSNPFKLRVLGNGHQKKSYLYVQDCIEAIMIAIEKSQEKINIFNLGNNEICEVNYSIDIILEYLGLHPELEYSGGTRGWVGDSPLIYLSCDKIRKLGWVPKLGIKESIVKTLDYLSLNNWLFDARK